jgi:hypothetical protein
MILKSKLRLVSPTLYVCLTGFSPVSLVDSRSKTLIRIGLKVLPASNEEHIEGCNPIF